MHHARGHAIMLGRARPKRLIVPKVSPPSTLRPLRPAGSLLSDALKAASCCVTMPQGKQALKALQLAELLCESTTCPTTFQRHKQALTRRLARSPQGPKPGMHGTCTCFLRLARDATASKMLISRAVRPIASKLRSVLALEPAVR